MSIITILLFFVYMWGLGFTVSSFVKLPEDIFEKITLLLGLGLATFPILSIILNLFHIPLDWKIFLFLSLIFPVYKLFKNKNHLTFPKLQFKLKKSHIYYLIAFALFIFVFSVYLKGSFAYGYLEDTDPWGHSLGIKYISMEKTAYDPQEYSGMLDQVLTYMDPYPPAYDILMAMLLQTSQDMTWTLKFFNALIISLGYLFFYIFAKEFMGDSKKAIFATFVLAAIPSYLSHFIWAHSLVITIFFPTMYAYLKIDENKKWAFIAAIGTASIWVSQNLSQPIKLSCLILLFIIVSSIIHKKVLKYHLAALVSGGILALSWWGMMIKKYGVSGFLHYYRYGHHVNISETVGTSSFDFNGIINIVKAVFNPGGTASRAYTFSDFFYAKANNMINNPIGVGFFLSILTIIGLFYILIKYRKRLVLKENSWRAVAIFWLIFTFWGVNGMTFPVSIAKSAFRTWMLMAIPIALIATEGLYFLKSLSRNKIYKFAIILLFVVGIYFTSATAKIAVNTSYWPTDSFASLQEAQAYADYFDSLPENSKVFLYSPQDRLVVGFGMYSCGWCKNILDFREKILEKNSEELYHFLKRNEYEYFVVNPQMDFKYFRNKYNDTENLLNKRYSQILNHTGLKMIHQDTFSVFKIV